MKRFMFKFEFYQALSFVVYYILIDRYDYRWMYWSQRFTEIIEEDNHE